MQVDPKEILIPELLMRTAVDSVEFENLTKSIAERGYINPPTVRKVGKKYELIAGYRRIQAALELELEKIPVTIMTATDMEAELIKMSENIDREDINPLDEGEYLRELMGKFGINQKQLADVIKKSEAWISNRVASVSWTEEIRVAIKGNAISFSVGRALMKIRSFTDREYYYGLAVAGGATEATVLGWAQMSNEQLEREEAGAVDGPVTQGTNLGFVAMSDCVCCQEKEPATEATHIAVCAYCAASVQHLETVQLFRNCKAQWKQNETDRTPPPENETGSDS